MYGFVIDGVKFAVVSHFGEETWAAVLARAGADKLEFSSHERYSERLVPAIIQAAVELSGIDFEALGTLAGKYFVHFICKFGYDDLLRVMGRRFADFLRGLDNLHEYFRFSYPKIRPPSFAISSETSHGVELHYRSRRAGYIGYVTGQLLEVAAIFYATDLHIQVVSRDERGGVVYTVLRLNFDNSDFAVAKQLRERVAALSDFLPVEASNFLQMFPFYLVFNKKMEVVLAGRALRYIIPDVCGRLISETFTLQRPYVVFTYDACRAHINNIFEMQSLMAVKRKGSEAMITMKINDQLEEKYDIQHNDADEMGMDDDEGWPLMLRGQMLHVRQSEVFVYLPTVMVDTLDQLHEIGIFINDYSLSDCNKDMILASIQQTDNLKDLLKKEKEESKLLVSSMAQIEETKKKTRDLLCHMMPSHVAKELLAGRDPTSVCEIFDGATICFAKIYKFQELSAHLSAMAVVNLLNSVYSRLDEVTETHGVYKVETIGESYMISCGAPQRTKFHAEYVADAALDMLATMAEFCEETTGKEVKIKIGMHSGPVVGGVVGSKAPRYCLMGDVVNCASRMESHNAEPKTLMASVYSRDELESVAAKKFDFRDRGELNVKGKGAMRVFGVLGKSGESRHVFEPLETEEEVLSDRNTEVFTPMDDQSEGGRVSSMGRLSVTQSRFSSRTRSRTTASRSGRASAASHQSGDASGESHIDEDVSASEANATHFHVVHTAANTIAVQKEIIRSTTSKGHPGLNAAPTTTVGAIQPRKAEPNKPERKEKDNGAVKPQPAPIKPPTPLTPPTVQPEKSASLSTTSAPTHSDRKVKPNPTTTESHVDLMANLIRSEVAKMDLIANVHGGAEELKSSATSSPLLNGTKLSPTPRPSAPHSVALGIPSAVPNKFEKPPALPRSTQPQSNGVLTAEVKRKMADSAPISPIGNGHAVMLQSEVNCVCGANQNSSKRQTPRSDVCLIS